jgi:hypothetical protein
MFFYDFNLKLEWRATHLDDAVSKGTLELTDITAPDDFDVRSTCFSFSPMCQGPYLRVFFAVAGENHDRVRELLEQPSS